jgi:hypothetical protein
MNHVYGLTEDRQILFSISCSFYERSSKKVIILNLVLRRYLEHIYS